jgi:CubicO group peptidase (beta-lactamase class C family)
MATTTKTTISALQARLDQLREQHEVPAASVAVLRAEEVDAAASGVLNLATGVEATADSLFQIGSITKVWTATLVMQLVDEGRIELDAPVRRYLPSFRVADEAVSGAVTIRHLLTHTSGIDGDHFADTGRGDGALERYVETCAGLPQVHPLGATMSYCNTGYTVLGRVLEVVTDTVWDDLLRLRLVEPLELTHTVTLPEDVLRFRAAIGHIQPPGQELRPAPAWGLPRTAGPAGAICSTATELLAFAGLHLRDGLGHDGKRLLSEEAARAMRTPQVEVPTGGIGESEAHWGLGWSVYTWSGRAVVGHDGGTIGQAAFLRVVPDSGAAVALLTNGGDAYGLFHDLCGELLAEVAGVELPAEPVPPASPIAVDATGYIGRYERAGASIEVASKNGGLVLIQTVTGLGSEMTPEPLELPLAAFDPEKEVFLTQHPALKGAWLPVRFTTLADGRRCLHIGGRATPRTG